MIRSRRSAIDDLDAQDFNGRRAITATSLCACYKVTRTTQDGAAATGDREIVPAEAETIRRIFRDYAAGLSPKAIAKRLNAERCMGPGGTPWNPSTIHGNPARGTGILNNELYVGRRVWNRLRYVKDPDSGKRLSRANPPSEWVTTAVPELRIVADELWSQVKARQVEMRRVTSNGDAKGSTRHGVRNIFSPV